MAAFTWKTSDGIKYLELSAFTAGGTVEAYFSTRNGGTSTKPYHSLNLGLHVGDLTSAVLRNRRLFSAALDIDANDWVAAEQVHGDRIQTVSGQEKGRGSRQRVTAIPATDALVTADRGIPITTYYADCVPLYFYDRENQVIALAHAGWKGTVARIGLKTANYLKQNFGTRLQSLMAAIGPSIRDCCYQVNSRVAEQFRQEFDFADSVLKSDGPEHWKLNLQQANYLMLLQAGLTAEHISDSGICTCCNTEDFFSHRCEGPTGRLAAVMLLV